MARIPFLKPALSLSDQITLLKDRGMILPNEDRAKHYLRFIGYYRLSGYWFPFQYRDDSELHDHFRPGTDFETVLDRYVFDRQLRLIVMDAVERIEVAARAAISNRMSEAHGPHWYLDKKHFLSSFKHSDFVRRAKAEAGIEPFKAKKQTDFIKSYLEKYDTPPEPPSWMIFEVLPFGSISMVFGNLNDDDKKAIAAEYSLPRARLQSWLHAASHLRNLCAHHSRVWNREFGVKPSVSKSERGHVLQADRFYNHAVAMQTLLKIISGDTHWGKRLQNLIATQPNIPLAHMGFPENWTEQQIWS